MLVVAAQEDVCLSVIVIFDDGDRGVCAKLYVAQFLGGISFPFGAHQADGRCVGEDGKSFSAVDFYQAVNLSGYACDKF